MPGRVGIMMLGDVLCVGIVSEITGHGFRHLLGISARSIRTVHHVDGSAAMENEFRHLVVVKAQLVAHDIVVVVLLGEVDVEISVFGVVGVAASAGFGKTIVIHDLGHGDGNATVGDLPVIS